MAAMEETVNQNYTDIKSKHIYDLRTYHTSIASATKTLFESVKSSIDSLTNDSKSVNVKDPLVKCVSVALEQFARDLKVVFKEFVLTSTSTSTEEYLDINIEFVDSLNIGESRNKSVNKSASAFPDAAEDEDNENNDDLSDPLSEELIGEKEPVISQGTVVIKEENEKHNVPEEDANAKTGNVEDECDSEATIEGGSDNENDREFQFPPATRKRPSSRSNMEAYVNESTREPRLRKERIKVEKLISKKTKVVSTKGAVEENSSKRETKCSICGKEYACHKGLSKHMGSKHLKASTDRECAICNRSFVTFFVLQQHMTRKHAIQLETHYECIVCGKTLFNYELFIEHAKTHEIEEGPIEGVDLAPSVTNDEDDRRDMSMNNSASAFPDTKGAVKKSPLSRETKCSICGKEYSGRSGLLKHMGSKHLKVSTDRGCAICNRSFVTFFVLQQHMAKNHNIQLETRYECIVCDKTFSNNELFVEHAKTHAIEEGPMDEVDVAPSVTDDNDTSVNRSASAFPNAAEDEDNEDNDDLYDPLSEELIGQKEPENSEGTVLIKEENEKHNKDVPEEDANAKTGNVEDECDSEARLEEGSENENDRDIAIPPGARKRTRTRSTNEAHVERKHMKESTREPRLHKEQIIEEKLIFKTSKVAKTKGAVKNSSLCLEHKCSICGKEYAGRRGLLKHMGSKHLKATTDRECAICNRSFVTFFILQQHMARKHAIQLETHYECIVCDKTFSNNELFVEHAKTHAIEEGPMDEVDVAQRVPDDNDRGDISVNKSASAFPNAAENEDNEDNDDLYDPLSEELIGQKEPENSKGTVLIKEENEKHNKDVPEEDANAKTGNVEGECHSEARLEESSDNENDRETPIPPGARKRPRTRSTNEAHVERKHVKESTREPRLHKEQIIMEKLIFKTTQVTNKKVIKKSSLKRETKCSICGKQYALRSSLLKHMGNKHLKTTTDRECDICNRSFVTFFVLQQHMAKNHDIQLKRRYECKVCGETFSSNELFVEHAKTHNDGGDMPGVNKNKRRKLSGIEETKDKRRTCPLCFRIYSGRSTVWKHIRFVHRKDPQLYIPRIRPNAGNSKPKDKCKICGTTFANVRSLRKHMRHQHLDVSITRHCKICEKDFPTNFHFEKHMLREHSVKLDKSYKCKKCGASFEKEEPFIEHAKTHIDKEKDYAPKQYQCTVCARTFFCNDTLKTHVVAVHNFKSKYKCHQCNIYFASRSKMDLHDGRVHSGKKNFTCEFCARAFFGASDLKVHIVGVHGVETDHKCDLCGKYFVSKCTLKRHVTERHGNTREHLCSECGMKFKTKTQLNQHSNVHTKVPRYWCKFCQQGFRWSASLEGHVAKFHQTSTPFGCDNCHKHFKTKAALRYHKKRHHSNTPPLPPMVFPCQLCNVKLSCKGNLTRHMKRKHKAQMDMFGHVKPDEVSTNKPLPEPISQKHIAPVPVPLRAPRYDPPIPSESEINPVPENPFRDQESRLAKSVPHQNPLPVDSPFSLANLSNFYGM